MKGGGIFRQLNTAKFTGPLETHTRSCHTCTSTVAVETFQASVNAHYLKGLCLSEITTEREREHEAVAVCYLYGCIVAPCGGVILQVAGRLALLHRETEECKND